MLDILSSPPDLPWTRSAQEDPGVRCVYCQGLEWDAHTYVQSGTLRLLRDGHVTSVIQHHESPGYRRRESDGPYSVIVPGAEGDYLSWENAVEMVKGYLERRGEEMPPIPVGPIAPKIFEAKTVTAQMWRQDDEDTWVFEGDDEYGIIYHLFMGGEHTYDWEYGQGSLQDMLPAHAARASSFEEAMNEIDDRRGEHVSRPGDETPEGDTPKIFEARKAQNDRSEGPPIGPSPGWDTPPGAATADVPIPEGTVPEPPGEKEPPPEGSTESRKVWLIGEALREAPMEAGVDLMLDDKERHGKGEKGYELSGGKITLIYELPLDLRDGFEHHREIQDSIEDAVQWGWIKVIQPDAYKTAWKTLKEYAADKDDVGKEFKFLFKDPKVREKISGNSWLILVEVPVVPTPLPVGIREDEADDEAKEKKPKEEVA